MDVEIKQSNVLDFVSTYNDDRKPITGEQQEKLILNQYKISTVIITCVFGAGSNKLTTICRDAVEISYNVMKYL